MGYLGCEEEDDGGDFGKAFMQHDSGRTMWCGTRGLAVERL